MSIANQAPTARRALAPTSAQDLARRIRAARDTADTRRRAEALTSTTPSADVLIAMTQSIAKLRALDSPAALIEHATREACVSCGFTRVMISRVEGADWIPLGLHVTDDAPPSEAFAAFVAKLAIPLSHTLVETDLVRRRMPMLVDRPAEHARTFKQLVRVSASTAYVAVPIMPAGRVIGLFHADRAGGERAVNRADLEHLAIFAEGFGLVFEDAILRARLERQRATILDALTSTTRTVDELGAEELELARTDHDANRPTTRRRRSARDRSARLDSLLTRREREVLELLATGLTNREMGARLQVSTATVKSHTTRIFRKLHVRSRAEATARFVQFRV